MNMAKDWKSFFAQKEKELDRSGSSKSKFRETPVPPKEFFEVWMNQPLWPEQLKVVEAVFSKDFMNWSPRYNELILFWGQGSGKDFSASRLLTYCVYWLLCLMDPQEYFNVGQNTPIDIANVSVNEDHAKHVFFSLFTDCLKNTKNPATGKNWFEEQGMDLREGKDLQGRLVLFPRHIKAYSLDSVRYTGEGKALLLVIFDEVGEFRFDRAKVLYDNLSNTALSRFPTLYKIVLLSYLRDEYDFMNTHWEETENWSKEQVQGIYKSKRAVWEVRLDRTKKDYKDAYDKDPEGAARRYENKLPARTSGRFLKSFDRVMENLFKLPFHNRNPVILDEESDDPLASYWTDNLGTLLFQPWFRPMSTVSIHNLELELIQSPTEAIEKKLQKEKERHESSQYFIHIDLSRGIVDYAGLVLMHTYNFTPSQIGYYVDLAIQLRPRETEINFEEVRQFVYKLQSMGFPIGSVTLDGFESADFRQMLEKRGLACEIISVDRTPQPYMTLKDLLYQGLIDYYYHPILIRELKELTRTPKGKVDHVKESPERIKEEKVRQGSKDISDALAGSVWQAVSSEYSNSPYLSTGEESTDKKLDRLTGRNRQFP